MSEGEDQVQMTAGERLRAAREAAGMSVDDVATTTRIPTRHLTSLETGDFTKLPAPTYSVGFARSYAAAVGLDRNEIGEQLRAEIGGTRLAAHQAEQFEPMDPARAMPRWLIFAVIGGIILVALLATWLNNRSLNAPDTATAADPVEIAPPPIQRTAQPQGAEPVAITATAEAWVQIKDGTNLLKEGVMQPGERFDVPPTAAAPMLTTGKAEALRITVGTANVPQVGPPATKVRGVSLLPAALLLGPPKVAAPPLERQQARPAPARTTKPAATAPASNAAEPAAPPQQ